MTGWKKTIAVLISITALSALSALLLASPDHARAASLPSRLTHARHALRHARMALRRDRLAYAAALAGADPAPADTAPPSPAAADTASPSPAPSDTAAAAPAPSASSATPSASPSAAPVLTAAQWHRVVLRAQHRVKVLAVRVTRLRCELGLRRAAARGDWMPIVRDAARHNRISAVGLRRLMSLESGGRAHAENGSYHGLYQYCWSTWRAAWNPWRSASLYNGEAQIRATALAIRRGWGASMWPNTYPRAF